MATTIPADWCLRESLSNDEILLNSVKLFDGKTNAVIKPSRLTAKVFGNLTFGASTGLATVDDGCSSRLLWTDDLQARVKDVCAELGISRWRRPSAADTVRLAQLLRIPTTLGREVYSNLLGRVGIWIDANVPPEMQTSPKTQEFAVGWHSAIRSACGIVAETGVWDDDRMSDWEHIGDGTATTSHAQEAQGEQKTSPAPTTIELVDSLRRELKGRLEDDDDEISSHHSDLDNPNVERVSLLNEMRRPALVATLQDMLAELDSDDDSDDQAITALESAHSCTSGPDPSALRPSRSSTGGDFADNAQRIHQDRPSSPVNRGPALSPPLNPSPTSKQHSVDGHVKEMTKRWEEKLSQTPPRSKLVTGGSLGLGDRERSRLENYYAATVEDEDDALYA